MKNRYLHALRGVLAVCIALCLCLCGALPQAYAQGEIKTFMDSEAKYDFLSKIGIFAPDDGTVLEKDTVTSRKILAMIAVNLRIPDMSAETVTGADFADIPEGDPYLNFAKLAVNMNIMTAENGYFMPEDSIEYGHLLKVIVCVLGYGELAESLGGYPSGYYSAAQKLGITTGISGTDGSVTLENAAALIYNSFDVSFMLNKGGYMQQDEKTTLFKLHGIETVTGLVNANSRTNIYTGHAAAEGEVQIEGEVFNDGGTNIGEYAGAQLKVFYKDNDDEKTVVYYTAARSGFEELKLRPGEFDKAEENAGGVTVKLSEGKKTIEISSLAREFYNGVYAGGADICDDLNILASEMNGYALLYDNDGNGEYDTVKISVYDTYVVKSVSSDKKVYLKDADIVYLDLSDKNFKQVSVTRNGDKKDVSDLAENDIIEVGISKDKKYAEVIATGEIAGSDFLAKVEGRLISAYEKDGYAVFDVDGLVFDTTVDFWRRNKETVSVGLNYVFYLNSDKKIAYLSDTATGEKYGYLLSAGSENGLGGSLLLKILTEDNKISVFEVSDKLAVVDGDNDEQKITVKSPDGFFRISSLYDAASGNAKRQLIKYVVNDWGKVARVYTAKSNFEFECIPVTEYNDDGTKKTATNTAQYSEEDFLIRSIERINPVKTPIYTSISGKMGGRVPINVAAPENVSGGKNCLEMNWTNFDIGKYIADDKSFSFGKYKVDPDTGAITGIVRDSTADTADALGNVPGHIESDLSVHRLVDYKYVMTASTVVFSVPGDIAADGNVFESMSADESLYKAMKMTVPGTEKFWFMHLYDIKPDYSVGAAVYIDNSAFEYGAKLYTVRGIVERKPERAISENGEEKLKITLRNYNNTVNEYFCSSDDIKDEGKILRYYTKDGFAAGAGSIVYEGNGDARSGKTYNYLYGAYEGTPISDLKPGAFISVSFDSQGEINGFFTYFDGDTSRRYYEDEPSGTDKFLNDNNLIKRANANGEAYTEKSYPYGNYTRKTIMGQVEISQNMSSTNFSYGKVKAVGPYYVVIDTNMPSFSYFDRLGSNNGSHSLYYRTEDGDIFRPITRVLQVKGQTNVFRIDSNTKGTTVSKTTLSEVQVGDIVYAYQPQWEYSGFLAVYKE